MGHGPFTSLNGVSAVGPGSSFDLTEIAESHTLILGFSWVAVTGSPNVSVNLEGSHDGSTWAEIANVGIAPSAGGAGSAVSSVSGNLLVRYVRANFIQFSGSGGVTSPSLTATIASR